MQGLPPLPCLDISMTSFIPAALENLPPVIAKQGRNKYEQPILKNKKTKTKNHDDEPNAGDKTSLEPRNSERSSSSRIQLRSLGWGLGEGRDPV